MAKRHYVPRYYLKGFTESPSSDLIWVYEKGSERVFCTKIAGVAAETGLWPDELETYLTNEIEQPAKPVLEKVRNRGSLTLEEKAVLATYMTVMLKRVPRSQARLKEVAPKAYDSAFAKVERAIAGFVAKDPSKTAIAERRLEELKALRLQHRDEIPKDIWYKMIPPELSPRILAALHDMTWRYFTFEKAEAGFITSDNPVFFFEGIGIGNSESEVTFPISRDLALQATWRTDIKEGGYHRTTEAIVHEINRRTASAASRYIYHSAEVQGIVNLVNKKSVKLNRIR